MKAKTRDKRQDTLGGKVGEVGVVWNHEFVEH